MKDKPHGGLKLKYANIVLGIVFIALALGILYVCRHDNLQFFIRKGPGPGFMPILSGAIIGLCGAGITITGLLRLKKDSSDGDEPVATNAEWKNFFLVIGLCALTIAAAKYIGLISAITLVMVLLIRFLGPEPWKTAIPVGVVTGIVMYLIFVVFLKVPVPKGPLGF